jgi:hypothetical protein
LGRVDKEEQESERKANQHYANAWDQGNYNQLPDHEVQQNYQQFVQNAPPEMVQQVHEQYYQQMPPQQRGDLMQGLLSGLMQRGFNPQQAGMQNIDPYSMTPQDAARLTSYTQRQQPGMLQQVMSNPMAKMAVAGVVAYAAKQMLGNRSGSGFGGMNF